MRSGLADCTDDANTDWPQNPFRQWTSRELPAVEVRHPPLFPPGTKFDNCNTTDTVLLSLVVETVFGQSLSGFIEQNI